MENKKTDITLDFLRVSNLLSKDGAKMVAEVGLHSIQQWVILNAVAKKEEISIGELKEETFVTKQNMTGMIDRLVNAGIVTLFQDPKDKRRTLVKLTEKGKRVYEQLKTSRDQFNAETYHIYDESEIDVLSDLLQRLVKHLKEKQL